MVYKVLFENNTAISAIPTNKLQHGDVELRSDRESVRWLALECANEKTAIEIAGQVVKKIWGTILRK
jgi:hypothetical protein